MKRRATALLTAMVLVALVPWTGWADDMTLSDAADQARWAGTVNGTTGLFAVPEACPALECSETTLTIALPPEIWDDPGAVQVSIRWASESQDLDLFVYGPDGSLAGKSEGTYSTAESAHIRDAGNGAYRVVVFPTTAESVAFEASAEVEYATPVEPVRDLLPDMISLPARNLHFQTSAYLFDLPVPSMPGGCYPEEMLEQGARKCLRFDQIIANTGDGAFELRYRIDGVATEETRDLVQRVYASDGSYRDRVADTYTFHPAHAHFHYENFAQSHLWASNKYGEQLGDAPVRSGRKNGFCMIDVEQHWFGERGDAPRTYIPPRCLMPTEVDPETGEMSAISGISRGWADVYNWYLADQFIEVSGLRPGYYILENVADQAGTVEELDDTNNSASVLIHLRGQKAKIVEPTPR